MRLFNAELDKEFGTVMCLATVLAVATFAVNLGVKGPMIQGDEGSYLANAAAIAGFHNDMASSYYAGYSILIAPAFWIAETPQGIWAVIKVINSILFFFIVFSLWLIAKYFKPEVNYKIRLASVTLTSCYPMWVIMAGYSFAQIAFVPVFLLIVFIFTQAVNSKAITWFILGIISGYLYWIHPTAIVALISLVIATTYIAWIKGKFRYLVVLVLTIGSMLLIYHIIIDPWLLEIMTVNKHFPNQHYPSTHQLLSNLSSLDKQKIIISIIGGHLFYLSIGTLGLLIVGTISLFEKVSGLCLLNISDLNFQLQDRSVGLFLLLSLFSSIALSATFLSSPSRLDHWMYGRYVEGVIAPVLLLGVLTISWRKALWAVPVTIVAAWLLSLNMNNYGHTAPFNVSAFWQEFFIRDKGLWIWTLTGVIGILVISLCAVFSNRTTLIVTGAFFFTCSFLQIGYHSKYSLIALERWKAANQIRDSFPVGTCVGFDLNSANNEYNKLLFWFDFGFVLYNYSLQKLSFKEWIKSCDGPFFSYSKILHKQDIDIYPVVQSPFGGPTLWVKGQPPEIKNFYPIVVAGSSPVLLQVLGFGWHDIEASLVWSSEKATLDLPIPDDCKTDECAFRIIYSIFGASTNRVVDLKVKTIKSTSTITSSYTINTPNPQEMAVPLQHNMNSQHIVFEVPMAISPNELYGKSDTRVLGLALREIHLVRLKTPRQ